MTSVKPELNAVLEAIYNRRAVRDYREEAVPEATVRALLEAAVHAPTAMHLEPWAFVVVQDPARLKRYSDEAKRLLRESAEGHRQLLKVPGLSPSDAHLARMLADPDFNIFYNAGTLIVICARPLGSFVTADCWLAAENLMLAATGLRLGSCCIGLAVPWLGTAAAKRELGIPGDVTAVAPIIVGVPAHATPPVGRKPPVVLRWVHRSAE